jgi:hypothetical protein
MGENKQRRKAQVIRIHAHCWDDGAFDFSANIGAFHLMFSTAPGAEYSSEPLTDYFGRYDGWFTLELIDWRKGCGEMALGYVDGKYFGYFHEVG